jgi:hypothetical protein
VLRRGLRYSVIDGWLSKRDLGLGKGSRIGGLGRGRRVTKMVAGGFWAEVTWDG